MIFESPLVFFERHRPTSNLRNRPALVPKLNANRLPEITPQHRRANAGKLDQSVVPGQRQKKPQPNRAGFFEACERIH
jgi:hypothetical protein